MPTEHDRARMSWWQQQQLTRRLTREARDRARAAVPVFPDGHPDGCITAGCTDRRYNGSDMYDRHRARRKRVRAAAKSGRKKVTTDLVREAIGACGGEATPQQIAAHLDRSVSAIRDVLAVMREADEVVVCGRAPKGARLYSVPGT